MAGEKHVVIGVCGSIAAYKTCWLIRLLVKDGIQVQVVMTRDAHEFITPLTLSTLSGHPVLTNFTNNPDTGSWNNHIQLAHQANALLIAPASANTIGKCANGLCDNLLTAIYFSSECPVLFAPAMDREMYQHPAIRRNTTTLTEYGDQIVDAEYGALASGLEGQGRMAEPETIRKHLLDVL